MEKVILLQNAEIDRIIGGIPIPSMNLLEGENDTGKSVFVQHLTWGALSAGCTVRYITTESTVKALIEQMESLALPVRSHFVKGLLRITDLHVKGVSWDKNIARNYLLVMMNFIKKKGDADVIIIDSLTYIATHATEEDLLNFLSELRNYVDSRKRVVVITLHPYAFSNDFLIRIRSICDGHIVFSVKTSPNKEIIRGLEVKKLKGAKKATDNMAFFKVEPNFGIKIMPFSAVKA